MLAARMPGAQHAAGVTTEEIAKALERVAVSRSHGGRLTRRRGVPERLRVGEGGTNGVRCGGCGKAFSKAGWAARHAVDCEASAQGLLQLPRGLHSTRPSLSAAAARLLSPCRVLGRLSNPRGGKRLRRRHSLCSARSAGTAARRLLLGAASGSPVAAAAAAAAAGAPLRIEQGPACGTAGALPLHAATARLTLGDVCHATPRAPVVAGSLPCVKAPDKLSQSWVWRAS
eukprot:TRINITY_DN6392_c0_g1_i2.p1 TRINITY_DN6392_c0_g1~~TRINITY_DN6392_c0_g1_i2.p1  ORF type:complete len:229 (+),score=36.26 TRINITY_DN6392_c0_g1_i2:112-798(+)